MLAQHSVEWNVGWLVGWRQGCLHSTRALSRFIPVQLLHTNPLLLAGVPTVHAPPEERTPKRHVGKCATTPTSSPL
jgi:hypothetical protein